MSCKAIRYPLSHPQQRIWYTDRFYQGTGIGNITASLKLKADIDYNVFDASINKIIEYNDALRLMISDNDGIALQSVSDYSYKRTDFLDFSQKPEDHMAKWERNKIDELFDLKDTLYYFALIKLKEGEYVFFMKLHHLITDAWSMVLLANRFMEYYGLLSRGEEIENPGYSYLEYINREQEYKGSQRFERDKEFWLEKFEILPENPNYGNYAAGYRDARTGREGFNVPVSFVGKLQNYCRENRVSVFTLFLTSYVIYINRITAARDLVIGTPVLNRSTRREKDTIGMFVSTMPLRIDVDEDLSFADFLKYITGDWMRSLRHQKYPYDLLIKELRKKNKNMHNLYDVLISYQKGRIDEDSGIDYESTWYSSGYQSDPLFVHINDREGEDVLVIEYDYLKAVFDSSEINSMHNGVMNILSDALTNPDKPIKSLDIVSKKEKNFLLKEFNTEQRDYDLSKTAVELIYERAKREPDKTAVVFRDSNLTYGELVKRADSMARGFIAQGVRPGDIVGILLNRSEEIAVCILAVLRIGACFLPIEPEYPPERIKYMLEDSGAKMLVSRKRVYENIGYKNKIFDVDNFKGEEYEGDISPFKSGPDDLAYVIYTSGSTGNPKAVMIQNKALVNFVKAAQENFMYTGDEVVLSVTTVSFDIFIFEFFPSLINGLKIVFADEKQQKIPELLSELIIKERITKILTTPSRMQLLVFGQSNKACFDVIEELILGGESFPEKLLIELKKVCKARIYNMYGPAEATVYALIKELTNTDRITIGKPLPNYDVYITDRNMNLIPCEMQGEICIGGVSVGKGYLNNPQLSGQRFLLNPFGKEGLVYRTGDLGILRSNGEIDFCGRMDNQIKIRGFRIELEEIEIQIARYPLIKEVVVMDKEDPNGRKYLNAYYVSDTEISVEDVKRTLSDRLPDYMIPSNFIRLKAIPLTPNGKTDRKALPDVVSISNGTSPYAPPRNGMDNTLISIWGDVLRLDNIGIDDNFFEIGGDSLTIIEIQIEMLKYNWSLNTQEFYTLDTIRKISDRLSGQLSGKTAVAENMEIFEIAEPAEVIAGKADIVPFNGFKYGKVLLTGATGFLGIHILKELLAFTTCEVYCIVRGKGKGDPLERLKKLIHYYFPEDGESMDLERVTIYEGDISRLQFGLSDETYSFLGSNAEIVIHNAAIVKYFGDYSNFENTNVTGTLNVAGFCTQFGIPLAHMSTLGISGHYLTKKGIDDFEFSERDFYVGQNYKDNVYVRSKFEAENILYKMMKKGLKANIFRLGNLTGRYSDGHFQFNDNENAFYNTLRSLILIEAVNEEVCCQKLEFTPVDYCAKAVTRLINVESYENNVYHIFNHNHISLTELIKGLNGQGIEITPMDKKSFTQHINRIISDDRKKKYLQGLINDLSAERDLDFRKLVYFNSEFTVSALEKFGFHWPRVNGEYIGKIIGFMKKKKYL